MSERGIDQRALLDRFTTIDEQLRRLNENLENIAANSGGSGSDTKPLGREGMEDLVGGTLSSTLAVRDGWVYETDDINRKDVQNGYEKKIDPDGYPGALISALLVMEGNNAEKTNIAFKTDQYSIDTTIEERKNTGITNSAVSTLPFVPIYSDSDQVYGAGFSSEFGYHWTNDFYIQIEVPDTGGPFKMSLNYIFIKIKDIEKFTEVNENAQ